MWLKPSTVLTTKETKLHEAMFALDAATERGLFFQILQNLSRRVRARPSGQPRARMRPRPAQIQILDRRTISRPIQQRTHREELIESQLPMEDVAAGEPVSIFKILRRNNLVRENQFRKFRRILCQRPDHSIAQCHALAVPISTLQ